MSVRKIALLLMLVLFASGSLPLALVQAQSDVAVERRNAEITKAIHFDKTTKPLREMFDTGETPKKARGGRDFEPGRPDKDKDRNDNGSAEDPLAAKGVGLPSAIADPKASVIGTPIDPALRVAP